MITTIYHVSVMCSDLLTDYLIHPDIGREFERQIMRAFAGCTEAGSNDYSTLEEWAEFDSRELARDAEKRALAVIADFQAQAERARDACTR